ncbi:MAG: nuclear transport factor 2 family protein [Salinibacterium sp.]|nr:nuclear transport factor 2 family protein [Salinibacterium sp.]
MNTYEVGKRLVELCNEGKHRQAIEELYADTVDVQEAMDPANMGPNRPEQMKPNGPQSKQDLLRGCDWFFEVNEVHAASNEGPYPQGDSFVVMMSLDMTPKAGPMAGQRMAMKEASIYKVDNGKIVGSRFCYHVPGCG